MRRDNYLCAYCAIKADTVDHVIPRSRGGLHAWENCVASCNTCNHRKADRLVEELGWSMRCVPAVPRGAHWRLIGAAHDGDPQADGQDRAARPAAWFTAAFRAAVSAAVRRAGWPDS
jgi:hypothetical protein